MLQRRDKRIQQMQEENAALRRAVEERKPRVLTLGDIRDELVDMIKRGAHPGSIDYVLKHKIRWDDTETWEDVRDRNTSDVDSTVALADDVDLVERATRALLHRWPVDEPITEADREQVRVVLRHADAALGYTT